MIKAGQDNRNFNMRKRRHSDKINLARGLEIIYEDRDIIVVDKPAKLLTMGTDREKDKTAYYILTDYVRKGSRKSQNRIFIVHRLDRDTSGVLIFAKNEKAKLSLQNQWQDTQKQYLAVVHGTPPQKEGLISSYLAENKAYVVYSTTDASKGKLAKTSYKVLKETGRYSLLELGLLTGRKNQIRVHLADIGCPVVGDRKYGNPKDVYTRLALHAKSISFLHPSTSRRVTIETKMPSYFEKLLGGRD